MLKNLVNFAKGKSKYMDTQLSEGKLVAAPVKKDIIARLEREILPLEGIKTSASNDKVDLGVNAINACFPNRTFPVGCIHEFLSGSTADVGATRGFAAALLSRLMWNNGVSIWISTSKTIFPPALKAFALEPDHFIFIDLRKEKDVLWTLEEALKCERITAVVGEINEIGFTESRRLQLAVEQSRVTGFLLRHQPRIMNTIASVTRWRVTALPSELTNGMPGVGFPRWNIELLKARNGKPGNWKLEWSSNRFQNIEENIFSIAQEQRRKTG
jgi:protein ImuA